MRKGLFAMMLALLVTGAVAARADEEAPKDKKGGDKPAAETPSAPRKFVTHHHVTAGGRDIAYTATAEDIDIKDNDGKPTARFFTISYMEDGKRAEDRPITFVFNGGPGSASIWLHFGLVGPKRIDIPSDATDPG